MTQHSEHSEFMKTVKDIRDAEREYDEIIDASKQKADRIMRDAKEKTIDERMKSEEQITSLKNDRLKKGSKSIESEVQKILDDAKDKASKVSKKKSSPQLVSNVVKTFVEGL